MLLLQPQRIHPACAEVARHGVHAVKGGVGPSGAHGGHGGALLRRTCGGCAKSGSRSLQGGNGKPSCAAPGKAPGQGEKDIQGGEHSRHPKQPRIHAPQGDHLSERDRAEHLAEPFGDIVDPHRPAGADPLGNRDFERIGSLRAGDDGIAQGEQRHADERRRESVEQEQYI